jgi:hypothetical protein
VSAAALSAGDTAWVLVSTAMVMLMVPGLALFYGGLVREKNSLNTLMMSVASLGVVGVLWVLVGYSLAFAPGSPLVGGLAYLGLGGVGAEPNAAYAGTIPHVAFAGYQGMFAAIAVALISGAVVERLSFRAYLLFCALWSLVVYAPLAHWVWGDGGWLRSLGALDFAGGTVVHVSAGTAAVVAAVMLGRRNRLGRAPVVPAQRAVHAARRGAALVRLVRLQRRLRARRERRGRGRAGDDALGRRRVAGDLDVARPAARRRVHGGGRGDRAGGRAGGGDAGGGLRDAGRRARDRRAGLGRQLRRDPAARAHRRGRRARRVRLPRRGGDRGRAAHRRLRHEGGEPGRRRRPAGGEPGAGGRAGRWRCWPPSRSWRRRRSAS